MRKKKIKKIISIRLYRQLDLNKREIDSLGINGEGNSAIITGKPKPGRSKTIKDHRKNINVGKNVLHSKAFSVLNFIDFWEKKRKKERKNRT